MKCLPFIYAVSHPTAQAFYPPSYLRIGRAALKRRYTRTCSLQSAQPGDRPPAGSLLHYLLTLTLVRIPRPDQVRPRNAKHKGGYFLLPSPIVTNSFYFRKWSALCCPDFPLAPQRCQRQSQNTVFNCKVKQNHQILHRIPQKITNIKRSYGIKPVSPYTHLA